MGPDREQLRSGRHTASSDGAEQVLHDSDQTACPRADRLLLLVKARLALLHQGQGLWGPGREPEKDPEACTPPVRKPPQGPKATLSAARRTQRPARPQQLSSRGRPDPG